MSTVASVATPWYRQRWPWLLMLGPALVVVAGIATLALAIATDDGLVADDYYKRGLAINRTLARTDAAAARTLGASVDVGADGRVIAVVTGEGGLPPVVRLRVSHPTRSGFDRSAELVQGPDGRYAGRIDALPPGRWRVSVETDAWKLPAVEVDGSAVHVALGAAR
jgi:hypothetical protein